jgi:hypothetical protein
MLSYALHRAFTLLSIPCFHMHSISLSSAFICYPSLSTTLAVAIKKLSIAIPLSRCSHSQLAIHMLPTRYQNRAVKMLSNLLHSHRYPAFPSIAFIAIAFMSIAILRIAFLRYRIRFPAFVASLCKQLSTSLLSRYRYPLAFPLSYSLSHTRIAVHCFPHNNSSNQVITTRPWIHCRSPSRV